MIEVLNLKRGVMMMMIDRYVALHNMEKEYFDSI